MKKTLLIFFLFYTCFLFAQESEFTLSKEGLTDYIVTECTGKTQSEIYKKTLNWISFTYNTPSEVLKASIENEYVRIEGSSNNMIVLNSFGKVYCSAKYQIEISFKDGKYKFDITELKYFNKETLSEPTWKEFNLNKANIYYSRRGQISSIFKYLPDTLPKYLNELNVSLKKFVMSDNIPSKREGW